MQTTTTTTTRHENRERNGLFEALIDAYDAYVGELDTELPEEDARGLGMAIGILAGNRQHVRPNETRWIIGHALRELWSDPIRMAEAYRHRGETDWFDEGPLDPAKLEAKRAEERPALVAACDRAIEALNSLRSLALEGAGGAELEEAWDAVQPPIGRAWSAVGVFAEWYDRIAASKNGGAS